MELEKLDAVTDQVTQEALKNACSQVNLFGVSANLAEKRPAETEALGAHRDFGFCDDVQDRDLEKIDHFRHESKFVLEGSQSKKRVAK